MSVLRWSGYPLPDGRYTVTLEHAGAPQPQWVARFCGEWLGARHTESGAAILCHMKETARQDAMRSEHETAMFNIIQQRAHGGEQP